METIKSAVSALRRGLPAFDVQKSRKKPDEITSKQEFVCVAIFSMLFFMWGLAYGLLDIMNYHIKVAMNIHRIDAALLALSYYFAYIPGSLLIGGPIVKKLGYRAGAVAGLLLLATGDQIMSVGASKLSLSLMCFSHFIVGLGVSTLERTANAYIVNVGPRKRAPLRILVAQSWAGIGTIIAPLLANTIIFDPNASSAMPPADPTNLNRCIMPALDVGELTETKSTLGTVVTFYRILGAGIYGLAIGLGVMFFITKWVVEVDVIPSPQLDHPRWKFWKHPLLSTRFSRLWYGVVANFFNLGCQVTVAQFFMEHMRVNACANDKWAANYMTIAQTAFVGGRLLAAGFVSIPSATQSRIIQIVFKPRYVLCAFLAAAVGFTGAGIAAIGALAIAAACMVMFAEAPSFPMIFESATAGFEGWTPTAETLMILSISGGGLEPLLMGLLVDQTDVSKGWILVTICFGLVWSYSVNCNIIPSWRHKLDAAHEDEKQGGK